MAVKRVSPGRYSDGVNTVNAKTTAEAVVKLKALTQPKPKPVVPDVVTPPVTVPIVPAPAGDAVIWLDVLGGAAYADACVQAAIYLIKKGHRVGFGFFWVEFGPAKDLFNRLYQVGVRHFRIQALWRATHSYGSKEQVEALGYAVDVQQLSQAMPGAYIAFSPFCEHNNTAKTMVAVFAKLCEVAPRLHLVNSVWQGEFVKDPNIINEIHSETKSLPPGPAFVSADGITGAPDRPHAGLVDMNVGAWLKKYALALAAFGWILRFNLNELKQDKILPKNRKAKATLGDILAVAWLLMPLPPKPKVSGVKDFPSGNPAWIWKCYSEDVYNANKGQPENSRERKPVCIFPKLGLGKIITITDINNRKICSSSPAQSFSGGGFRAYFSLFGWEMAEAAFKSSGSEWVVVVIESEKYLLHPAWRWGVTR